MHLFASLAVLFLATLVAGQSPLTTMFTGGNSGNIGGGIYFDINVTNPAGITITQIDFNSNSLANTPGIFDVLTIPGTRTGNQTNLAAWTGFASLGNAVTTAGPNVPTVCVLATPLPLPTGSHGMAFRSNGFAHRYTNGNGTNQNPGNADLTLACGEASNVAFAGSLFTPRVVNCSIHYIVGSPGTVFSQATPYGNGCGSTFRSFYENFTTAAAHDLGNSSMSMILTGGSYLVLSGIASYVAPSAAATTLTLANDSEVTVALAAPMPIAGGTTSNLTICSNGFVSVASGNGVGPTPSVATFLNAPQTGFWCWHDYSPGPGTGLVKFEQVAGVAYVTWDGVWDSGGTSNANANTFQFQFHLGSGLVHIVWGTMSGLGNGHLIGYSPGGASLDPGNRDLTATLPGSFQVGLVDLLGLSLAASPRPIVNTSINLTTSNITPTTPFGAVAFGLTRYSPPIDLTGLGMPGCHQHHDILVTLIYLPFGAPSVVTPLLVPNLVGLVLQAQSYNYDPGAALTPLGAVSSRALSLVCGDW